MPQNTKAHDPFTSISSTTWTNKKMTHGAFLLTKKGDMDTQMEAQVDDDVINDVPPMGG